MLQGLGHRGVANVDRIALAIDLGVDIPYIAYRDTLGEPSVPAGG